MYRSTPVAAHHLFEGWLCYLNSKIFVDCCASGSCALGSSQVCVPPFNFFQSHRNHPQPSQIYRSYLWAHIVTATNMHNRAAGVEDQRFQVLVGAVLSSRAQASVVSFSGCCVTTVGSKLRGGGKSVPATSHERGALICTRSNLSYLIVTVCSYACTIGPLLPYKTDLSHHMQARRRGGATLLRFPLGGVDFANECSNQSLVDQARFCFSSRCNSLAKPAPRQTRVWSRVRWTLVRCMYRPPSSPLLYDEESGPKSKCRAAPRAGRCTPVPAAFL